MKQCTKCKENKELDQFPKQGDKWNSHCKACKNAWKNEFNKLPINVERKRATELRRNYWPHLTISQAWNEYNRILSKQNDSCGLCKKHKSVFDRELSVDHDHATGKIRGILCNTCNRSVVRNHTIETAKQLVSYLKKHQ